jgi:molybdate transport system substrate-binding protein
MVNASRSWLSRRVPSGNRLVLIAPANSIVKLSIGPNFQLAQALGNGRLAIADPSGVPAGKYGKAALEALGVWSSASFGCRGRSCAR